MVAMQWIPSAGTVYWFCELAVGLSKTGTPSDAVQLKVYKGGSTPGAGQLLAAPSGAPIGMTTVTASSLTGSVARKTFTLDNCISVQGNGSTAWWFVVSRTGSENSSNYYNVETWTGTQTGFTKWSIIDVSGGWVTSTGVYGASLDGVNQPADIPVFSSSSYAFANTDYGWFGNMLRDLAVFLFVPSNDAVAIFDTGRQQLATKIPYSYFLDIKNSLGSISSASGQFPTVTYEFNLTGSASHITLFSYDVVTHYITPTQLGIMRTLMSASLWFGFMFVIIRRVRTMFKE